MMWTYCRLNQFVISLLLEVQIPPSLMRFHLIASYTFAMPRFDGWMIILLSSPSVSLEDHMTYNDTKFAQKTKTISTGCATTGFKFSLITTFSFKPLILPFHHLISKLDQFDHLAHIKKIGSI